MANIRSASLTAVIVGCILCATINFTVAAPVVELITAGEAALPDAPSGRERGISRGPTIVVESPSPAAGTIHSPFELKLEFVSHGDAKINPRSVLVTYLKEPAVDLTQRLKPFIAASGIDVQNAETPPGRHWLRVNVTDTEGHEGSTDFAFTVSRSR